MESFSELITLQERFEDLKEKLQDSLESLEAVVGHISEGLVFVTQEGIVSLFNPAAEEILGCNSEHLNGKPFWDHFDDLFFGFSMKGALQKSRVRQRAIVTLNEVKDVEISTSSIPNKGLLLLLQDRTEIHLLEKTLHHNERLKELGEMAATLAHEIRNPLGGVIGFASLLKRELTDLKHQQMTDAILKGTTLLNNLVTRILDYSKPLTLHFAPINLVKLIEEAITSAQSDCPTLKCTLQSEKNEIVISGDSETIKGTLLNLLRNAFEAEATEVKFFLSSEGVLSCSDNGVGINKKDLPKIFTPFFTTKPHGTGLGLAHCYKVITQHGGTIDVASEEKKGTTFRITL